MSSSYKLGGKNTIVREKLVSAIINKSEDSNQLGYLSYVTIICQNQIKVTVITAYGVCNQNIESVGPQRATNQ